MFSDTQTANVCFCEIQYIATVLSASVKFYEIQQMAMLVMVSVELQLLLVHSHLLPHFTSDQC
jgi:hypothetical protein